MSSTKKKIVGAAFSTITSLVMLAVAGDVVPLAYHKYATYLIGALGIVGTTFLPAIIGQAVTLPKIELPKIPSALVAVGLLSSLLAGGACWSPARKNDPKCVVLRDVVDCSTAAVKAQSGRGLAIVTELINQGTFNTDALISALAGAGISSGECVLAAVAKNFLTTPRGVSAAQASFMEHRNAWLRAKYPSGVTYKD